MSNDFNTIIAVQCFELLICIQQKKLEKYICIVWKMTIFVCYQSSSCTRDFITTTANYVSANNGRVSQCLALLLLGITSDRQLHQMKQLLFKI